MKHNIIQLGWLNPALVAQGIEHWFPVPKVGGSNPLEGTSNLRKSGSWWAN